MSQKHIEEIMSKKEIKQRFVDKLELFYRNFGSDWRIEELVTDPSQQEYLLSYLVELDERGVISLKEDGRSFRIIDLPSNHTNLIA